MTICSCNASLNFSNAPRAVTPRKSATAVTFSAAGVTASKVIKRIRHMAIFYHEPPDERERERGRPGDLEKTAHLALSHSLSLPLFFSVSRALRTTHSSGTGPPDRND